MWLSCTSTVPILQDNRRFFAAFLCTAQLGSGLMMVSSSKELNGCAIMLPALNLPFFLQGGSIWRLNRLGFPNGPGLWDNPETFILLVLAIFYAYHALMLVFGNFHLAAIIFGEEDERTCLASSWTPHFFPSACLKISQPRTWPPMSQRMTAGKTHPAFRGKGTPRPC